LISRSKRVFYGLLSILSLASVFAVGTTAQAKTTEKPLTSIPKALRGYWYQGDDEDSMIIHFASKRVSVQRVKSKKKKQSFLKYKPKKESKAVLSQKAKTNKAFTFVQFGHNNWYDQSISNTKRDGKTYWVYYYYLRGAKKHPKLTFLLSGGIGGFPAIVKDKNPMKGADTYTKVNKKYLKSIGFYK